MAHARCAVVKLLMHAVPVTCQDNRPTPGQTELQTARQRFMGNKNEILW
jgi:hypothetical protein